MIVFFVIILQLKINLDIDELFNSFVISQQKEKSTKGMKEVTSAKLQVLLFVILIIIWS